MNVLPLLLIACILAFSACSLSSQGGKPEFSDIEDDLADIKSDVGESDNDDRLSLLSSGSDSWPSIALPFDDGAGSSGTLYGWMRLKWDIKNKSLRGNNYCDIRGTAWVTKTPNRKGPRVAIDEVAVWTQAAGWDRDPNTSINTTRYYDDQTDSGLFGRISTSICPGSDCVKAVFTVHGRKFKLPMRCRSVS